ncbi:protein-tyrosine phosphatase [Nakamurella sp. UYEF19]|uniref:arsenate reductase/protein-tyrosine-phosphatase family protein n=1 Tax=Nakamurella sp. UYEF19 TaxID=1756392 RepID=UPI00339550F3
MSEFRVLMVCTANYCRSPIAEQLLASATRTLFGISDTWKIESAGTDASTVRPIHEFSAQVLINREAFVDGHRSREIDPGMLRNTDLILTAAREHRSAVVRMLPAAIGRTFTMLQFARLAGIVDPIRSADAGELGRRLLTEAKAARSRLQPVPPEDDDLPDPMGRPLADFEACASTLDAVVASVLRPLRLEPVPATPPR